MQHFFPVSEWFLVMHEASKEDVSALQSIGSHSRIWSLIGNQERDDRRGIEEQWLMWARERILHYFSIGKFQWRAQSLCSVCTKCGNSVGLPFRILTGTRPAFRVLVWTNYLQAEKSVFLLKTSCISFIPGDKGSPLYTWVNPIL